LRESPAEPVQRRAQPQVRQEQQAVTAPVDALVAEAVV